MLVEKKLTMALPLSDHCDYDELFRLVEQVNPKVLYCTHGPEDVVEDFRQAGFKTYFLERAGHFDPRLIPMSEI